MLEVLRGSLSNVYLGKFVPQNSLQLTFTRPKAGQEVGALNWTQEPKSVWDGPTSTTTGQALRPARDWPVLKSASVQACAQGHCAVQRSWHVQTFSKSAILHRFLNFSTLRVEIFRIFFRSRLPMTPKNDESFMEIGPHVFWEIRKTRTKIKNQKSGPDKL